MTTIKTQIVDQYRRLRLMQRTCMAEKSENEQKIAEAKAVSHLTPKITELQQDINRLNKEKSKQYATSSTKISVLVDKKDRFNQEIDSQLSELRKSQSVTDNNIYTQICALNEELYALQNEQSKILSKIKRHPSSCPSKQPRDVAEFDRVTESNILKFLNGEIKTLSIKEGT